MLLAGMWTLVWALATSTAIATPPTDCDSPSNAADSVFAWLQPKVYNSTLAAQCLDRQARSQEQLEQSAKRIKAVYDAKALYVKMEPLNLEENWTVTQEGRVKVALHKGLPGVVIVRQPDGTWMWPKSSLDRVDTVYGEMFSVLNETVLSGLPGPFRKALFGIELWQYLALGFLIVLGLVVRRALEFILSNRLRPLVKRFGQDWAVSVVGAVGAPGATLIMALVLWLTYPALRLPIKVTVTLETAIQLVVTFSIVWGLYRMVDVVSEVFRVRAEATESKLDDQLVPLLRKALKMVVVLAGAVFVLQNLDVNVASLLAGLGIGGLAFAFAAQDTLANFFGSVMIFLDHPFQIGDWIVFDGAEGVVEEVGFRSTRIRTFYNSLIVVPNSKFTADKVDNYGVRQYRRCFTTLGITYDTTPEQMQAFVEGIRAIIQANPHTRKDYYEVHMSGFGNSALQVMLYFFFIVPSWTDELRERHNVFLEIMRLAKDLDVSFAFPTTTLHVKSMAQPSAPRPMSSPKPDQVLKKVVESYGPNGSRGRPTGKLITGGYTVDTFPSPRGSEDDGA